MESVADPQRRPPEHDDVPVLFVCSGNTCRSPLAAAAARAIGIAASSAGIAASPSRPASSGAVSAAARIGLDLSAHESRLLTDADVAAAPLVLVMTASQAALVVERWPEHAAKVERLDASADIDDPFGGDDGVYDTMAIHIVAALEHRFGPPSP